MKALVFTLLAAAGLTACTTPAPTGPNVAVMPAPNKPFEVFQQDNYYCQDYARNTIGVSTGQQEQQQIASSAVTGAAIGAVAGAALGGHGDDAAAGAGAGLLAGTVVGMDRAQYGNRTLQERYDIAYMQCMYAKGNQVPGYSMQTALPPPPPQNRR